MATAFQKFYEVIADNQAHHPKSTFYAYTSFPDFSNIGSESSQQISHPQYLQILSSPVSTIL